MGGGDVNRYRLGFRIIEGEGAYILVVAALCVRAYIDARRAFLRQSEDDGDI